MVCGIAFATLACLLSLSDQIFEMITAKEAQVRPQVLKKGWTKSQQNDLTWLDLCLGLQVGTLYM